MTLGHAKDLLRHVAEREITDTYDAWPAVQARLAARRRAPSPNWRWAAGMAAALAVVLAGGTMLITSTWPAVNAEAILETAAALGDGPVTTGRTYHMTSTTTIHPTRSDAGAPIVQSQETWFGGGARMRQETRMPEFATLIVNDGVQAWLFDPNTLAPEYPESRITRPFPFNGYYPDSWAVIA